MHILFVFRLNGKGKQEEVIKKKRFSGLQEKIKVNIPFFVIN